MVLEHSVKLQQPHGPGCEGCEGGAQQAAGGLQVTGQSEGKTKEAEIGETDLRGLKVPAWLDGR